MTKGQFWFINIMGFLAGSLLLVNVAIVELNQSLITETNLYQNTIASRGQLNRMYNIFVQRVAQSANSDPQLLDFLKKNDLIKTPSTMATPASHPTR